MINNQFQAIQVGPRFEPCRGSPGSNMLPNLFGPAGARRRTRRRRSRGEIRGWRFGGRVVWMKLVVIWLFCCGPGGMMTSTRASCLFSNPIQMSDSGCKLAGRICHHHRLRHHRRSVDCSPKSGGGPPAQGGTGGDGRMADAAHWLFAGNQPCRTGVGGRVAADCKL